MRIGLDIDDTLTDTKKVFKKYAKKYKKKHHLQTYSDRKMLSEEDFHKFIKEYGKELYYHAKIKKNASKMIQKWMKEGHEIYFITARNKKDCEKVEIYTKGFLACHHVPFDNIIFNSTNKYLDSKDLKLDIFVDDREKVLDDFPKTKITLIRMIPSKNIYSKYQKVTNWKEIDDIINNRI